MDKWDARDYKHFVGDFQHFEECPCHEDNDEPDPECECLNIEADGRDVDIDWAINEARYQRRNA